MVQGRRDQAWNHTASLLAKLHNLMRGENDEILQPSSFHPNPAQLLWEEERAREKERQDNREPNDAWKAAKAVTQSVWKD